jgi:hypothetical protein
LAAFITGAEALADITMSTLLISEKLTIGSAFMVNEKKAVKSNAPRKCTKLDFFILISMIVKFASYFDSHPRLK